MKFATIELYDRANVEDVAADLTRYGFDVFVKVHVEAIQHNRNRKTNSELHRMEATIDLHIEPGETRPFVNYTRGNDSWHGQGRITFHEWTA
ncbi:MAG: hypothetical protein R3324_02650 [Halobacteriales archaeon]|nr:hypothetical protein [Halobacteriales archaeon]